MLILTTKLGVPLTLVLQKWGLTLEQSAAVILLYCGSGLDEQSPALVLIIYLYQKARQRFRADEYKIPHHRQYLPVVYFPNQFKVEIFPLPHFVACILCPDDKCRGSGKCR